MDTMVVFSYAILTLLYVTGTVKAVPACDQPDANNLTYPSCSSCRGYCGKPVDLSTRFSITPGCSCDELCHFYRDCCHDFDQECHKEHEDSLKWMSSVDHQSLGRTKCLKASVNPGSLWKGNLAFIASCRGDEDVCARSTFDANSYIPIFDKKTGLHYNNLKCASCNGVGVEDIVPWQVDAICKHPYIIKIGNESVNVKEAKVDLGDLLRETAGKPIRDAVCRLDFKNPPGKRPRSCVPETRVKSSCDESCANKDLTSKCQSSYTQYVKDRFNPFVIYKNPYCAMCDVGPGAYLDCNIGEGRKPRDPWFVKFSFTSLFDFDPSDGLRLSTSNERRPTCPSGQEWTYYQCREILDITPRMRENMTDFLPVKSYLEQVIHNVTGHRVIVTLKNRTDTMLVINVELPAMEGINQTDVENLRQKIHTLVNATLRDYGITQDFYLDITHRLDLNMNCSRFGKFDPSEYVFVDNSTLKLKKTGEIITRPNFRFENGFVYVCIQNRWSVSPLQWLTLFLISLSMLALCVRLVFHFLLKEFHNPVGRVQTSLAFAVLLALLFFLVGGVMPGNTSDSPSPGCYLVGVLTHWAFLAMFAWTSAVSVDILRMFWLSSRFFKMKYRHRVFLSHSIFAWLTPTVLVIISIVVNHTSPDERFRPQYGRELCWFNQRYALIVLFVVPVSMAIFVNIIMFILSVILLCRSKSQNKVAKGGDGHNVSLYLKLFVLMGITWCLGVIREMAKSEALDYIYVILNASQGFLLVLGSMCTANIRNAIRDRFCGRNHYGENTRSSSSKSTTSTSLNTVIQPKKIQGNPL